MVFRENEYGEEPKGGQNKIADTFTITTICRSFGSDVIRRNCDEKQFYAVFHWEHGVSGKFAARIQFLQVSNIYKGRFTAGFVYHHQAKTKKKLVCSRGSSYSNI